MLTFDSLKALILADKRDALWQLAQEGELEGFTEDEKKDLTFSAAQSGSAPMLRSLFQSWHLYSAEPDSLGRTALHFAAMSGNPEAIRFAMETVGFDPLQGDMTGRTALDYAVNAPDSRGYHFLTESLGFTLGETYRNPVLRGFHPDPSIVRHGSDYYLVNSSFSFFPGLPVFHSADLIHWQLIGHAAENLETCGLKDLPGGFGYWAPDISCHRGKFWVVATLRRNTPPYRLQMITSAADPAGPWTAPKFLPLDGIDPSLFTDSDGRRYILLNPGAILSELDEDGNLISEPEMIFYGSARIKPEGPHLLKKDGWYYLFLAEGGTGPEHMETVQRSRSLRGPYTPCPFNPVLGRKNPLSPVQRSGHGKLVSTPEGNWYMVYLCGRTVEGKTVMGRETALDPVTWTADGWPVVNWLRGPSCLQRLPYPNASTAQSGIAPAPDWISPRNDPDSFAAISASRVTLKCGPDPAAIGPCSLLLQRQEESCFTQSARVDLQSAEEGAYAGLAGYYDECSFFLFGLRKIADRYHAEITEQKGSARETRSLGHVPFGRARLRIEARGLTRTFYLDDEEKSLSLPSPSDTSTGFSPDSPLCSLTADYLSDEGAFGQKRFTGATLGLFAIGHGKAVFSELQFRFLSDLA